ncbi:unnamed protein product [Protopolystoma xenopodis]|uniref:Protein kinase domain-containing protein n=1 Tax=Protopolystoma xenopodis TaxID=117903 RepID=A0A3S5BYK4_9PLAT|nr:unnamed protein product [Protopolystoma xenopodis]
MSIFDLLTCISDHPAPRLPSFCFSDQLLYFVHSCLAREPADRLSLDCLAQHAFLNNDMLDSGWSEQGSIGSQTLIQASNNLGESQSDETGVNITSGSSAELEQQVSVFCPLVITRLSSVDKLLYLIRKLV